MLFGFCVYNGGVCFEYYALRWLLDWPLIMVWGGGLLFAYLYLSCYCFGFNVIVVRIWCFVGGCFFICYLRLGMKRGDSIMCLVTALFVVVCLLFVLFDMLDGYNSVGWIMVI